MKSNSNEGKKIFSRFDFISIEFCALALAYANACVVAVDSVISRVFFFFCQSKEEWIVCRRKIKWHERLVVAVVCHSIEQMFYQSPNRISWLNAISRMKLHAELKQRKKIKLYEKCHRRSMHRFHGVLCLLFSVVRVKPHQGNRSVVTFARFEKIETPERFQRFTEHWRNSMNH